jgi:hypothetical protein
MIGEFIFARAQPQKLSLKETAIRRRVTHKKSDLVDAMFKDGIGFEAMPLSTVVPKFLFNKLTIFKRRRIEGSARCFA